MGRRSRFLYLPLFLSAALQWPSKPAIGSAPFHAGGVGDCAGCHSMHNIGSSQGMVLARNPYGLIGTDPSSTCLSCHLERGRKRPHRHLVATAGADMPEGSPPAQLTPGGDFGWLNKGYRWGGGNQEGAGASPGEHHGHNIVAADYLCDPDTRFTMAPGGKYPAKRLSCISCHDPHGTYRRFADGSIGTGGVPIQASGSYESSPDPTVNGSVGVYRLLGGIGYQTSDFAGEPFTVDPPAAVAPADYNRPEDWNDTRVAYGAGMSEWCANCHPAFLGNGVGLQENPLQPGRSMVHPAGRFARLTSGIVANYNSYVGSGNLTGNRDTAYTSMVPFEMGTADYAVLKRTAGSTGRSREGADTDARVMCLTCHRAHASGWDQATRWNMKTEFLVYDGNYPGADDPTVPARISQGRTRAESRRTFYERPPDRYAGYQRSLCNKCHARD